MSAQTGRGLVQLSKLTRGTVYVTGGQELIRELIWQADEYKRDEKRAALAGKGWRVVVIERAARGRA